MFKVTDENIRRYREDGFFITDVAFTETELKDLRGEFDRLWREEVTRAEKGGDARDIDMTKLRPFIGHVHKRSETAADFTRHVVFQEICGALIGPDADLYFNQAVMKPPGKGKAFCWHQDTQYIITNPLEYVTCWVAAARATVDNGTIWIVPGMHKHGLLPHVINPESKEWDCQFDSSWKVPVVLRAGQMAVFNSLLPHASGPNISNETRYAYVVQYHVPSVRHRDNGELAGDQFPMLREGRLAEPVAV